MNLIRCVVLMVSLITVVTTPAWAERKASEPIDEFELATFQACGSDRDCVKAVNGCCDCANGGRDVAVSKYRLKEFKAQFDCSQMTCGSLTASPACGSGLVTCVNKKCQYVQAADAKFRSGP